VTVNDQDIYAALRRLPKETQTELFEFLKETGIGSMRTEDLQERLGASADLKKLWLRAK